MNNEPPEKLIIPTRSEMEAMFREKFHDEVEAITKIYQVSYGFALGMAMGMRIMAGRQ